LHEDFSYDLLCYNPNASDLTSFLIVILLNFEYNMNVMNAREICPIALIVIDTDVDLSFKTVIHVWLIIMCLKP